MLRADTIRALLESLPDEIELRQSEAKVVIGCSDNWLDCGRLYAYGPRFVNDIGLIRYPVAYLRESISQHTVDTHDVAGRGPRRHPADIRRVTPASQQKAAAAAGNTPQLVWEYR